MPAVILDQAHWTQLEQVQLQVDHKVAYESDMDRFGVPDWWEPAVDKGDCEDIVLAKRQKLMDMGWPADALRVAVVLDGHGLLHAVLTVDVTTAKGAPATYVLDSHFEHVEPWSRLNEYGYTWLERSKPGSEAWVRLDNGTDRETQRIAGLASQIMPASPRWGDTPTSGVALAAAAPATVTITASVTLVRAAPEVEARPAALEVLDAVPDEPLLIRASLNGNAEAADPDSRNDEDAGEHRRGRHRHSHGHGRRHTA